MRKDQKRMKQIETPLYDAIASFAKRKPLSFHVPGHKGGLHFSDVGREHFNSILEIDVTELSGLDDLHAAEGCIAQAQALLAELYGAKKSYLLVNGSTVGNLAMILAVCKEGDFVLVQRNCHKSILHGIELAGAVPVLLQAELDEATGLPVGVTYETVKKALTHYPEAKALILTHPNYYGQASDLSSIVTLAHASHIPVLVDEAHGAHFCLGEPFPVSALAYGADVVVHSAHKTLPAMTMGSYLHLQGSLVQEEEISRYLGMLQSSSPSYPIMASLDLARFSLAQQKKNGTKELESFLHSFYQAVKGIKQVTVLQGAIQDPLKVTIQTRCKLSGYELQSLFEKEGIYTELADPYHVLFILPLFVSEAYIEAALRIKELLKDYAVTGELELPHLNEEATGYSALPYSYKQLQQCETELITFEQAEGGISADMVIPYPPGIPLIMKGERITKEQLLSWRLLREKGAHFQGAAHIQAGYIKVYKLEEEKVK